MKHILYGQGIVAVMYVTLPLSPYDIIHYNIRYMEGLVQDRRNSSALAMELCLFCTNP